mmetsp:Transcript_70506/g.117792  ORF Transcript_70506/g.117792 Transcript_70506/m.117792 type:complete len:225 (+) Transcript_70506:558-1232(+)
MGWVNEILASLHTGLELSHQLRLVGSRHRLNLCLCLLRVFVDGLEHICLHSRGKGRRLLQVHSFDLLIVTRKPVAELCAHQSTGLVVHFGQQVPTSLFAKRLVQQVDWVAFDEVVHTLHNLVLPLQQVSSVFCQILQTLQLCCSLHLWFHLEIFQSGGSFFKHKLGHLVPHIPLINIFSHHVAPWLAHGIKFIGGHELNLGKCSLHFLQLCARSVGAPLVIRNS